VLNVIDKLAISLQERDRRGDYELRGRALQALIDADRVPSDRVDVEVSDRWITLVGEVDCQFQSRVAEEAVAHLAGIDGISNQLRVARFAALVQKDNAASLSLAAEAGGHELRTGPGEVELVVELPPHRGIGERVARALREAAAGTLVPAQTLVSRVADGICGPPRS
jgi:hypothetical protein